MQVSVITWNMDHWKGVRRSPHHTLEAWRYVEELGADVSLLQEAVAPPPGYPGLVFPPPSESGRWRGQGRAAFGTAVAVRAEHAAVEIPCVPFPCEDRREHLTQTHKGAFVAVKVSLAGRDLLAVSLYGVLEGPLWDSVTYSVTSVHRSLSDLTPVLNRSRSLPVVLGGDLNVSTQIEPPHREAHRAVFSRLRAFGLESCTERTAAKRGPLHACPCDEPSGCIHVRTHRHSKSDRPWQDDYLLASARHLIPRLISCEAVDEPRAWELSDHCPVRVVFEYGEAGR